MFGSIRANCALWNGLTVSNQKPRRILGAWLFSRTRLLRRGRLVQLSAWLRRSPLPRLGALEREVALPLRFSRFLERRPETFLPSSSLEPSEEPDPPR